MKASMHLKIVEAPSDVRAQVEAKFRLTWALTPRQVEQGLKLLLGGILKLRKVIKAGRFYDSPRRTVHICQAYAKAEVYRQDRLVGTYQFGLKTF